ncbi:hypothetical protein LB565_16900 [Mesorhizobium sp. CA14]|uniref:hypothetical protein n=1 Tax=Mesorhizobium sp. CA14 TaxID=2876642 RepID=UPI001CCDEB7E|nr:hypothetical protein [Mesorhizobium sp. CA14]MBZ9849665.1 hypothetical protein [Mesorhizobium sp. CA14]
MNALPPNQLQDGYVDLDRHFSPLPESVELGDDYENRIAYGLSPPSRWADLLKEYRVIILAEAGAGKTEEIRHTAIKLRDEGKDAFFIRLEYLPDGIEDAFEGGQTGNFDEFQQWKSSQGEGWIFLDSVDEARLVSPQRFELAIRVLSKALGDAVFRARFYITSRVSEWRPKADLTLVNAKLPFVPAPKKTATAEVDNIEEAAVDQIVAGSAARISSTKKEPQSAKIFSLARLTEKQVRIFAAARGLTDLNAFIDAINRNAVDLFASRPRDLEDLIDFWQKHGRIGSRLELIKASVEEKLKEADRNRAASQPLSFDMALEGAMLLAAAVTFQKEQRISVPDSYHRNDGIVVSDALRGWTDAQCRALLARPIFDEAIYGSVRFHHRSVREYLTAAWLSRLLMEGNSRRRIENLFFRRQYGMDVIIPSMRGILPWLALLDERVRERAYSVAPELLIEGGDPSQFPPEFRNRIVKVICERQAGKEAADYSFDIGALQRFANADIGGTVKALLATYADHSENRNLLMRMVWQGQIKECFDEVYAATVDESAGIYTRLAAMRAMAVIADPANIRRMIDQMLPSLKTADHRIIGGLIEEFGNSVVTVDDVLKILKQVDAPERFSHPGFVGALAAFIDRNSVEQNAALIHGVGELLRQPPYEPGRHFKISARYAWLVEHAGHACEKLIVERSDHCLSEEALTVLRLYAFESTYHGSFTFGKDLGAIVPRWAALNDALFWHEIAVGRRDAEAKGERLIDWWRAAMLREFVAFRAEDFTRIVGYINERPLCDDKLVALSLAFTLYRDNKRPRPWLGKLKKTIQGNAELEARLHTFLHPHPDPDGSRWKKQDREFKQRRKRREATEAKRHAGWKQWLNDHLVTLRDVSVAKNGTIWQAQAYLLDRLRHSGKENLSRWAYSNWRDLIPSYGDHVAKAFRDGLLAYWREFTPKLRSEGIENPASVPYAVVLGLCGIEIEAEEVPDWPANLTADDALRAARYGVWELNGFPTWMEKLFRAFEPQVRSVLASEIAWELDQPVTEQRNSYVLSDVVWHGTWAKAALGRTVYDLLKQKCPASVDVLRECLQIISESTDIPNIEIAMLAEHWTSDLGDIELRATWFAAWVSVSGVDGLTAFTKAIDGMENQNEALAFCMRFAVTLTGNRRYNMGARQSYMNPSVLKDLYLVLHRYIRVDEDIERAGKGVYSPTIRDEAQNVRNHVFSLLQEMPGKLSFLALKEVAESHPLGESRPWMWRHVRKRAELDADSPAWTSTDVVSFAHTIERRPQNHRELFELATLRLLDLKDEIEEADDSIASVLLKVEKETEHRNFVGKWLRDKADGKYSVPQEEELADTKKPDIRVHGVGFDAPLPIEAKIVDNDWTGPQLFERLENQLCNDYLRDVRSNSGIFLLIYRGTKTTWEHPTSKQKLSFAELVPALQGFADGLIASRADIEAITVIGIDLTRRAAPKRF